MIPPLDVFKVEKNEPSWLGFADTVVEAIEIARKRGSGVYFVFLHDIVSRKLYKIVSDGDGCSLDHAANFEPCHCAATPR
jgi:hypothetical protein